MAPTPRRAAAEVLHRAERRLRAGADEGADRALAATGALHSRLLRLHPPATLRDAEFRVFSQFGEDGIIQHLVARVPVAEESFVEFGVDDYRESNTRFLLVNDNWRGLILDAGHAHTEFLERSGLAWRHSIDAVEAFITRDNINELLGQAGFTGDIGLLSIDVDGNDYWIWEAIDVVEPRIVVVEYNSVFGPERAVTVPYRDDFARAAAHHSHLYFGASLAALVHLGTTKGYRFVGGNRAGNNAFFVREDVAGNLPAATAVSAWVPSRFRESRGADGSLTYVTSHDDRLTLLAGLPVVDVRSGEIVTLG